MILELLQPPYHHGAEQGAYPEGSEQRLQSKAPTQRAQSRATPEYGAYPEGAEQRDSGRNKFRHLSCSFKLCLFGMGFSCWQLKVPKDTFLMPQMCKCYHSCLKTINGFLSSIELSLNSLAWHHSHLQGGLNLLLHLYFLPHMIFHFCQTGIKLVP